MSVHVLPAPDAFADHEAEQAALGAILLDPGCLHLVRSHLEPGDFASERHRLVAAALWALWDRAAPIDVVTVRGQLDALGSLAKAGGVDYLAELTLVTPSTTAAEHYARTVADSSRRRRLRAGLTQALDELGRRDVGLDEVEATIDRARTTTLGDRPTMRRMNALMTEVAGELAAIEASPDGVTGLRTGIGGLDVMLGGLRPGQLVVLAARPSLGKTTLATQMVWHIAASEARALLVSAEMPATEIVLRMLSAAANTDAVRLRTDGITPAVSWAMGKLSGLPLWIDDRAGITVAQIRARARYLAAQGGLDVIAVDYVGLLGVEDRRVPRVEQIAAITRDLKALAKEMRIPVILLSQLNRQSEHDGMGGKPRRPKLSDLRDSGALEQDADVVLFLWRDRDEMPRSDGRLDLELIVAKHRGGPKGTVRVIFDGPRFRFAGTP